MRGLDYRGAGVDLEGADRHVEAIAPLVTATWGQQVVGGFGGFAAGVELPPGYRRPVLMLATDGVGTKLELARRTGLWDGVGFDLVAMCVDDLAAAGAAPLGFVDYLAVGRLHPERDRRIVASVAAACTAAACALVGGETAEHPGVVDPEHTDLAGAALGVVEWGEELTGERVAVGDVVIGLLSPNLRSNGFSLVRRVMEGVDLDEPWGDGRSLGEVLLEPSIVYSPAVLHAIGGGGVRAAAHITGGGIPGNLVRPLPEGRRARLWRDRWVVPEVFGRIQALGAIDEREMFRTFNMGIGFCLVVAAGEVDSILDRLAEKEMPALEIGEVVAGERGVELV